MSGSSRGFWNNQGGAGVVEFALLIGPFLVLMFGVVEFGRAFWMREALSDVSVAAARCAAVPQRECSDGSGAYSASMTQEFIAAQARGRGITLSGTPTVTVDVPCDGLDGFAVVALEARFNSAFPIDMIVPLSSAACFPMQAG